MNRIILGLILIFEIFTVFSNRGGGPLLSHIVLTVITFLILCVCLIYRKNLHFQFRLPYLFYFIFLALFLISFFWSLTPSYGLNEILLFANVGILLVVLSSVNYRKDVIPAKAGIYSDTNLFLISLTALAVIVTLIGYFIYIGTAFPRFTATFVDLRESFRATGNDYANFILLILPFALWQALKRHNRITTVVLAVLSAAILMSGFLLSFSRAAWFSFLGIVVVMVLLSFLRKQESKLPQPKILAMTSKLISVIVLTTLLVSGLQAVRSQKFETVSIVKKLLFQADEGAASASNRLEFWQGAVQIIKDRPIFGGGVRSFRYLFPQYQKTFGITEDHPHNIFLKIGVENGFPSALVFAAFLIAAAVLIFKFLRKNPNSPILFLSLGSLGALAHNFLDFNFVASNFTLFIVFIALSLRASVSERSNLEPRLLQASTLAMTVILFLASLALLSLSAHEGYFNADFKRGRFALEQKNVDEAAKFLERTRNLFFSRDSATYLADAYRLRGDSSGLQAKREAGILFMSTCNFWSNDDFLFSSLTTPKAILGCLDAKNLDSVALYDAEIFARLGEFFLNETSPKNRFESLVKPEMYLKVSERLFSRALELDPKNNLKYYYGFLAAQKKQEKTIDEKFKQKTLELLTEYKTVLEENRKLTVLTENPEYAVKLYDFFGMKKESEDARRIWFKEIMKFEAKYNNVIPT